MAIEVGDVVYMVAGLCPGMTVASVDEHRAECWWFDGELHLCKDVFPLKVLALSKKREEEFVVDSVQTQRFPDGFVRVTTEGRVKDA